MGGGPDIPDHHLHKDFLVREATEADLNDITEIVKAGFPDDPGCDYKYPYRGDNEEDFRKWTQREYEEYLNQPEKYCVLVVTAPQRSEDAVIQKPISFGVWDCAVEIRSKAGDHGINERRDANRDHVREYREAMSNAFSKNFLRHGNNQLNLLWLITIPKFRCQGAGSLICYWGQEEAKKRHKDFLTVMASPMGKNLYKDHGYGLIDTVMAQRKGEEEKVEVYIMEKQLV
ncbi:acyl-CoA N-acyltransferase [Camillea tinctor]|nr:acyl-CoA N-acyltransferase [Camillea tinctor]